MPVSDSQRERHPAISPVYHIGIDILSFQKDLYHILMPVRSCLQERCPSTSVCHIQIDILSFQKDL
ncbi:hypothetical protein L873DRAFT_1823906 [Choiromyces venosus 120613-1]|uniref:Uncharacterized protein n=1 Tax=Choiromyces venosus 120613-1 TaxID=1336337 RepID=A0A3N4IRR9_9PEZI|nr:hypothetical protein L873DRAFT_1823906 [Choiromyces venosus 120613-1]